MLGKGKRQMATKHIKSPEEKIEALSKISGAITSDLYLEDILKLIVTVTAEVMGSKICSLMLLNGDKKELVIRATQSVSQGYNKKPHVRLGEGVAGKVAEENRPMTIVDVKEDERYINRDIAKKEGLCSLVCVPLAVKGRVIGVLNSYTSEPHEFTETEIAVLTTVANQAAMTIENTELLVKTKVIQEELETRKVVEKAKGILMRVKGLSEEDSFRKIQKYSMNSRKSMREVAEAIIMTHDIER
jgi:signal transduction protein with GAF and PtsI domain